VFFLDIPFYRTQFHFHFHEIKNLATRHPG
jgi:hypothetical protein